MPNKKNKAKKAPPAPVMAKAVLVPIGNKKKKKRSSQMAEGVITFSRVEMLVSVQTSSGSTSTAGVVNLNPDSLPWLSQLSKSFERYRWDSLQIHWRGATGTTFGGLMAFGVDWTGRKKLALEVDRSKVLALTPLSDVPVWSDSTRQPLVLPKKYLSSRPWYGLATGSDEIDTTPGQLAYACKHDSTSGEKFLGEFWISYKVTLQGTNAI